MNKLQKPYPPEISIKGIENFEKDQPGTWLYGPFVNAVLEACETIHPVSGKAVADFMALDYQSVNGALKVATGYSFREFYTLWVWRRCWKLLKENPDIHHDELARRMGFTDRKSLWKYLHAHGIVKNNHEAYDRPRPRLLDIWNKDKIPTGITIPKKESEKQ